MKRVITFFILLFTFFSAVAQEAQKLEETETTVDGEQAQNGSSSSPKAPPILNNNDTTITNPLKMRDPFKRRLPRREGKSFSLRQRQTGKYVNVLSIEDLEFSMDQLKVVGVLLGEDRRAIAKIAEEQQGKLSEETYIIKEGMKLGENNAEVKAILPGGVVLVERIKNVYDQYEYLETVIPLYIQ